MNGLGNSSLILTTSLPIVTTGNRCQLSPMLAA